MGTKLLRQDIRAGLDLPMRILIFKQKGDTYLLYHDPMELSQTYRIRPATVRKLRNVLKDLTKKAAGR